MSAHKRMKAQHEGMKKHEKKAKGGAIKEKEGKVNDYNPPVPEAAEAKETKESFKSGGKAKAKRRITALISTNAVAM